MATRGQAWARGLPEPWETGKLAGWKSPPRVTHKGPGARPPPRVVYHQTESSTASLGSSS